MENFVIRRALSFVTRLQLQIVFIFCAKRRIKYIILSLRVEHQELHAAHSCLTENKRNKKQDTHYI